MSTSLNALISFLKIPSISADPLHHRDINSCAQWLCDFLTSQRLRAEVCETPGHPIVLAKNEHRPDRKTVLFYGHYDVQPVDPLERWNSPPFEPKVADGSIYARGATDNKGQIMAHILGVASFLAAGDDLPLNVTFLIEGEEEVGSTNLEAFIRERQEQLACDVVVISDTGMLGRGIPTLTYSLRGLVSCELTLTGPSSDLHSGIYGGAVLNPATALSKMLASLHDDNHRVTIPGFYDAVKPLQEEERVALSQCPLNDEKLQKTTGVPCLVGEAGYTPLECCRARPTVEINGLTSGYQGVGSKTIVPSQAKVKLSARLVADQEPSAIMELMEKHFHRIVPNGVTMQFKPEHQGSPYFLDPKSKLSQVAQRTLSKIFNAETVAIREGGSIPIVAKISEILGVDVLLAGLSLPEANTHAPNESFLLENFEAGIRLNQELLKELSEAL